MLSWLCVILFPLEFDFEEYILVGICYRVGGIATSASRRPFACSQTSSVVFVKQQSNLRKLRSSFYERM